MSKNSHPSTDPGNGHADDVSPAAAWSPFQRGGAVGHGRRHGEATPGNDEVQEPSRPGRVVLVGAGPGDVELLTCKAARLIAEADWLIHDALVQPKVLALARRARLIPVGKRAGNPSARQSTINQLLLDCAARGGLTVRLKGGDPLIFARAREELDTLHAAGIPVEVVPGISTAQAAHAALAMPMTERGLRRALVLATPQLQVAGNGPKAVVTEVTAHSSAPHAWAKAVVAAGSGTLYMASTIADQVRGILLAHGMPACTPALWLIDVSLPSQRVLQTTLGELCPPPETYKGRPALLILGVEPAAPVDPEPTSGQP
ncbi:MAG: uroporphyrinogen-III C-methyltransferase [Lautropia sp.]|nr:uroporphyrinogen-III C-methyltransferase [Lautropia sp.]